MKYFAGLDAGGTKTFCLVADETGTVHGFGRGGTGNYEYYGVEPAARENRAALEGALAEAGLTISGLAGIGMGVAGADLPEDYEMLERELYTPLLGSLPRVFRNDSMAGLRGGTKRPYGIVIACGTGCVCAGKSPDGNETRVGGLGEEFGDKASGSSIGQEGLRLVWRARDGIIPPTKLTDLFVARGGCRDVEDLFLRMYRRELGYKDLEPMSKLVFDAAFEGDEAACQLLEEHGRYLGHMVNAVARHLDMCQSEFEVVMAGSVFKGRSPVLIDAMRTIIHQTSPMASLTMPIFEPVVGALLLGMELELDITDEIYQNLEHHLAQIETRHGVKLISEAV